MLSETFSVIFKHCAKVIATSLRFFVEDNRVQLDNTSSWILSIFWLAFRSFLSSTDANTSSHSDKCIKGKEEEEETKSYITTIVEMKLRFSSIFSLLYKKNVAKKNAWGIPKSYFTGFTTKFKGMIYF